MLPNEQKKPSLFLSLNIRNDKLNSTVKYKLCELLKTSLFRFCILYLWDLCRQGQAMCYATLTAQIPQIFCEQAEKEEVCRRKPTQFNFSSNYSMLCQLKPLELSFSKCPPGYRKLIMPNFTPEVRFLGGYLQQTCFKCL